MDLAEKRKSEIKMLSLMIGIYCRRSHNCDELCDECKELLVYASSRVNRCPFMETKTFCSSCKSHCYSPIMRERIRDVMRYSGKWMLIYHPIIAVKHIIDTVKKLRRDRNDKKEID